MIAWKDFKRTWSKWYSSSTNSLSGFYQYSCPSLSFWSTKKKWPQSIGRSKWGLTTKIHMIAWNPDHGMIFSLSPGNESDFKAGMKLIQNTKLPDSVEYLAMDKGYSFYQTFAICEQKNLIAVVPPKANFKHQWLYDRNIYLYRNEIERFFNRIKNFRRVSTRYDKLDIMFSGFILFGMIALLLRVLC